MFYRLSSYIIHAPIEGTEDEMLLHGYTGAVDIINKDTISYILNHPDNINPSNIPFSDNTLSNLINRGYLTSLTPDEEHEKLIHIANVLHALNKRFGKNFGFIVSYDCNLRCPYCYEAGISNFGDSWNRSTLTHEQVDAIYKIIDNIEPIKQLRSNKLILYGGEPLLKENYEIVNYIVKKGESYGFTFSAITNGYDLSVFSDLLGPGKIENVQITVDGPEELHNSTRVHRDRIPTFERIINNISLALDLNVKVKVRMNCDQRNLGGMDILKDYFRAKGFIAHKNFSFYGALAHDFQKDLKFKNKQAASVEYVSREGYAKQCANCNPEKEDASQDEGITDRLLKSFKSGRPYGLLSNYCGIFSGSYFFDPKGNIHSCWGTIGKTQHRIGTYSKDGDYLFNESLAKLHDTNVGKHPQCSKCRFALICRGGCSVKDINMCAMMPRLFGIAANRAYKSYFRNMSDIIN